MSYDVNCAGCQAIVGACIDCGGCFRRHCQCDPCQHGKARADIISCVFCRPATQRIDEILGGGSDLQPGEGDRDEK